MKTEKILSDYNFTPARLLAWSKHYPDHVVHFNASIFTEEEGKVWFGDLDITVDAPRLQEVATNAGRTLYVLGEMDGRFENEKLDSSLLKDRAVATYVP